MTDRIACAPGFTCRVHHTSSTAFPSVQRYCVGEPSCTSNSVQCTGPSTMAGCIDGQTVEMTCNAGYKCSEITVLETGDLRAWCDDR
ncbi:MAG: hypothetical protein ACKV2T_05925 [Kofleriaceae bacterium]